MYLVLETCSQQQLVPRIYKKAADTRVDLYAKQFLIFVLVVGIWADSRARNALGIEGEAVRGDDEPPAAGLPMYLLLALPGLAPLLLQTLFGRLDRKPKAAATLTADADVDTSGMVVVRVHQDPPGLARLRQRQQVGHVQA